MMAGGPDNGGAVTAAVRMKTKYNITNEYFQSSSKITHETRSDSSVVHTKMSQVVAKVAQKSRQTTLK